MPCSAHPFQYGDDSRRHNKIINLCPCPSPRLSAVRSQLWIDMGSPVIRFELLFMLIAIGRVALSLLATIKEICQMAMSGQTNGHWYGNLYIYISTQAYRITACRPTPSYQQFVPASLLAAMDISVQWQQFHVVAVVNDGEIALSPRIFEVSPVIRRRAVAEAQREQAGTTIRLFINTPSTVQNLRAVEQYVLRAEQTVCPEPPQMDVPTLMTIAELAVELDIPRVADMVTSDICQVLERDIVGDGDVRDNPWVALCLLATKTNDERFYGNITRCFSNATRATRSQKEALWAFRSSTKKLDI